MTTARVRRALACVGMVALVVLVAGCTASSRGESDPDPGGYRGGASVVRPYALPDEVLTDTAGHPFNLRTSPSKPALLVFFGYSHCPDICNTMLADAASALARMPVGDRDQIQLVFVTTDPARDTPAAVDRYLARFDPDFIGLTGPLATIKGVAGRIGVDIEGVKKLPDGGYDVGHTALLVGFDARRSGVVVWSPSTPIGALTYDFTVLVDRSR